jgi:phage FluMu protein Com
MSAPDCPNCGKLTVRKETGHHPGWDCPDCQLLKPDIMTKQESRFVNLCRHMDKEKRFYLLDYMHQLYDEKKKCSLAEMPGGKE